MKMFKTDETVHIEIIRPWFAAKDFVRWDEQKYGADKKGSSIDAMLLQDNTIKYIVLNFPETNTCVKTSIVKIKEYLINTPQALKKDKKEIVIPLSICVNIPNDTEYDVDINQF